MTTHGKHLNGLFQPGFWLPGLSRDERRSCKELQSLQAKRKIVNRTNYRIAVCPILSYLMKQSKFHI